MDNFEKIYNMTYEQAAFVIGDLSIVPNADDNYSISEYQIAKAYAIKLLLAAAPKYRVVGIVDWGQGFKRESEPVTDWFDSYEDAKAKKLELEKEQERIRKEKGFGYFAGWYKIEKRCLAQVSDYVE